MILRRGDRSEGHRASGIEAGIIDQDHRIRIDEAISLSV